MHTKKFIKFFLLLVLLFTSLVALATPPKVALTIDDLPYVGKTNNDPGKLRREKKRFEKILAILKKENIPAAGFVVAGAIEKGQWALLEQFHQDGNLIANHTYSHINLNRTSAKNFIANIARADKILSPLLTHPKYFRYPFLATGRNCTTRLAVKNYLSKNNYVIAPVTIDTKDFRLNKQFLAIPWRKRKNYVNSFRKRYLNVIRYQTRKAEKKALKQVHRPIKQILLIHMNTLNAYFLLDIIKLYHKMGYKFITLPAAMQDNYYKLDPAKLARLTRQCYKLADKSKS